MSRKTIPPTQMVLTPNVTHLLRYLILVMPNMTPISLAAVSPSEKEIQPCDLTSCVLVKVSICLASLRNTCRSYAWSSSVLWSSQVAYKPSRSVNRSSSFSAIWKENTVMIKKKKRQRIKKFTSKQNKSKSSQGAPTHDKDARCSYRWERVLTCRNERGNIGSGDNL